MTRRATSIGLRVLAAVAATLLPAGAAHAESVLRVGYDITIDSLDPHLGLNQSAVGLQQQLFSSIAEWGVDGKPEPGTASGWTISDDGRTYTVHLREGALWSDGTPVTADDYVYSARRFLAPETASISASYLFAVEGARAYNAGTAPAESLAISAPDPQTVEIRLTEPNPYFEEYLTGFMPVPRHVIEANGAGWTKAGVLVSNGDYVLLESVPDTKAILVRNPYGAHPDEGPDRIEAYTVGDEAALVRRFQAGEIDLVPAVGARAFDALKPPYAAAKAVFPAGRVSYVSLGTDRPPFDDPRAREALSLAIDRKVLAEKVMGGGTEPAHYIVAHGWADLGDRPLPDFSPKAQAERLARAKALVAEIVAEGGAAPAFDLLYSGPATVPIALRAMWQQAGFAPNLLSREPAGLYGALDAADFQAGLNGFSTGLNHDPGFVLGGFEAGGFMDFSRWRDAEFLALMAKARATGDLAERTETLAAAERRLMSAYITIPIVQAPARWLIAPRVTGWSPAATPVEFRHLTVEGD